MTGNGAIERTVEGLAPQLLALAEGGERRLVGIAGPPGSGKSTLAEELAKALNARSPGLAEVVPMDGFHLDDAVLKARGIHARKGAPFTFDPGGLLALLTRLRRNEEEEIAIPVFDRRLEIARAGGRIIAQQTPLLLVEGNYLLLNRPPWDRLHPLFDLTIRLDVPIAELERRLTERWIEFGLAPEARAKKIAENDLPNARVVMEESRDADITLRWR